MHSLQTGQINNVLHKISHSVATSVPPACLQHCASAFSSTAARTVYGGSHIQRHQCLKQHSSAYTFSNVPSFATRQLLWSRMFQYSFMNILFQNVMSKNAAIQIGEIVPDMSHLCYCYSSVLAVGEPCPIFENGKSKELTLFNGANKTVCIFMVNVRPIYAY